MLGGCFYFGELTLDSKHYYNLLMKSFEDAIRSGSGIIDLAQCRAIELEQANERNINEAEGQEA